MRWRSTPSRRATCRWISEYPFQKSGAIRVNIHDRAVQTDRFDLEADQLLALPFGEQSIDNAGLHDRQGRINQVEVLMRDDASLSWQLRLDPCVLFECDFHV
jgi:hypothetical protein